MEFIEFNRSKIKKIKTMNNQINWLITLTDGAELLRVAVKISSGVLQGDAEIYPMEPENKEQIFKLLPLHCQSFGKIVDVEEIFEIVRVSPT